MSYGFGKLCKRLVLAVLVLLLLMAGVAAFAEEAPAAFQPIYPLRSDAPALTEYGLLPEDSEEDYYLVIDKEAGEWTYIDHEMFINIRQFKDVVERDRNLIWYETEIKLAPGVKFQTQHANPEHIGRKYLYAHDFARQKQSIFAISDDFYGFRVYAKRRPGVIIQDGVILADDTLSQPHWTLPTYDVIALYGDGSMKTYLAGEIGAEELLAQGATDVWCFGPVLLSNSEIGQQVLEKKFEYINPRQTLGMIEPNHYLIMTVEGRHKDSDGVGLVWCAERMRDLGCTEALNLDGGNSVKLVFMGSLINSDRHYNKENDRTVTSMITLGTFPLETILGEEE
ncbi:MAG: phosphodiester glycosidase family protein [Clostridiales bacterium]|nr:phosphodiester glycosidase family protein [Clostridiales bacterium]